MVSFSWLAARKAVCRAPMTMNHCSKLSRRSRTICKVLCCYAVSVSLHQVFLIGDVHSYLCRRSCTVVPRSLAPELVKTPSALCHQLFRSGTCIGRIAISNVLDEKRKTSSQKDLERSKRSFGFVQMLSLLEIVLFHDEYRAPMHHRAHITAQDVD